MISPRLRLIARQEFFAELINPLFWVLLVSIALVVSSVNAAPFIPSGDTGVGGALAYHNSQHALAANIALCSFFAYPFFASLMAGLSVIRDDEHQISELLHSTPLSAREYLFGKWTGILAALGVALAIHLVLLLALRELPALIGTDTAHGPFALVNYVVPMLLIAVPLVYFIATISFVVGAFARRPMAVYFVPIVFFVGTLMFTWTWAPSTLPVALDRVLVAVDATGLRWIQRFLFANDQGLTFYNSAPVAFDRTLLISRLLILVVPAALMLVLSRRAFGAVGEHASLVRWPKTLRQIFARRVDPTAPPQAASASAGFARLTDLAMSVRTPGFRRGMGTVLAAELRQLRRQPALWGFVVFLMFVVVEAGAGGEDAAGASIALESGVFAVRAIPAVTVLLCLYLLFAVVELMYRDVATRFDAIGHAAPLSEASLLGGRGLALFAVIVVALTGCFTASVLQLSAQGGGFDIWPLLLIFGAVLAPTFMLWTSFLMAVVSAVKSRTAALAIGIAALTATGTLFISGEMTWANNWPLWGVLRWSDFGVFPLNGRSLLLNRIGALALTAFFAALTMRTFTRVEADPLRNSSRRSPRHLLTSATRLVPFAFAPLVIVGFLSIRIDAGFQGASTKQRVEQHFLANATQWSDAPMAQITALDARFELDPAQSRASVAGTYVMRNNSSDTIPELVFTVTNAVGDVEWTLGGASAAAISGSYLHRLAMPRPLAPNDSIEVGFRYELSQPVGMTRNGGGTRSFILAEGALLSTRDGTLFPSPGFVDLRENAPMDTRSGGRGFNDGHSYTSRIEVRAPREYTVNSVGKQMSEETTGNFTTVVWESETPVASLNLIAGRWNSRSRDGSAVFYHSTHDSNVDVMLDAMTAARERYSSWFGAYPWTDLRLSEFPDLETNATAFPTNISMSEGIGFLSRGESQEALAFSVVAHEVAHQWWGHLITAGSKPGDGLMVEGMANYATLLLHESARGTDSRAAYSRQLEASYLSARRASTERGLLLTTERDAGGEAVLSQRGAFVLWMLRDAIGADRMDDGVRNFAQDRLRLGDDASPEVLLAQLQRVAPDAAHFAEFIEQWMRSSALPEFTVHIVSSEYRDGQWQTGVSVENVGTGSADVEIELQGGEVAAGQRGPVARQVVTLNAGQGQVLQVKTDFSPRVVVVDPDVRVLQRNRDRARTSRAATET